MYASIYITFPDLESARRTAHGLIERRFAACANLHPVRSFYRWEGGIEESEEIAVLLKARAEDFPLIEECVRGSHPYLVPCIVMYGIESGFPPYLEWIKESTDRPRAD